MSWRHRNVKAGNRVFCFGQAFRCQVLLHREMCKLYNRGTIHVDHGKQTGACGPHCVCWVFRAPIRPKDGSRLRVEIEREKLCELLDTEGTGSCGDTPEESVRIFPVLFANILQRALIRLIERLRQFIQNISDALWEAVAEVDKLTKYPTKPRL